MELKQLEYFRAIVDAGTISGAARELHMTQPPLSYQMKMLESELQVPLFLRGTKRIILTEAGKTLYEQAGNILMLTDLTKREVIKSSQAATLHIGMTPSTVSMMSEYLLRFARKYPQVHFDVHEGSTFTLKDQLENRMIDLTTLRTPIVLNGCETRSLAKESLLAMAVPEYPLLKGRSSIRLQELSEQPLILSHRYRKYMLTAFERAGLVCDIYFACEDARTAMTMAEKGLGIAILPASMLELSDRLKSCTISNADLTTEILLAWRKGRLPAEIQDFLNLWEEDLTCPNENTTTL
ncbi:MAG: LysR family transcriptional regulator [Oliverpabstia sp.]